ncbi:MAG: enoyl-CoA hydratase, partial [Brevundimonas sp.]|nr:enoyl-CoA hydratase [Brevundimonas sp.]
MTQAVRTELVDGVLNVVLARPEKKNSITQAMYSSLAEAVNGARTDDAVRVVLFRSEGDSFSAGNDIMDFIAISQAGGGATMVEAPVFQFL